MNEPRRTPTSTFVDDDVDGIIGRDPQMTMADRARASEERREASAEETALVVVPDAVDVALAIWGTSDFKAQAAQMLDLANTVREVIESQNLYHAFNEKKYVTYEGWALADSMLGIQMNIVNQELVERGPFGKAQDIPIAWAVEIELMKNGTRVGHARAICSRREAQWRDKSDNQLIQMAQTRAMGAANRRALGFIPKMAGFESGEGPDDERELDPETGDEVPTQAEMDAMRVGR